MRLGFSNLRGLAIIQNLIHKAWHSLHHTARVLSTTSLYHIVLGEYLLSDKHLPVLSLNSTPVIYLISTEIQPLL